MITLLTSDNKKLVKGVIVKQISNQYTVDVKGKLYDCRARGRFFHDNITPLVGDYVEINTADKYILDVLPRKNSLLRPSIANVDASIIVVSAKEPKLDLNLLDKLLVIIIHNKIKPIICITKIDLLNEKEITDLNIVTDYYKSIGIKVFNNTELKELTNEIQNKIVVLAGQTGAGKSSLLNKLDKTLNLETNPISRALGRGIHTTRHVELFPYKTSLIADTPGFSSIDINTLTNEQIRDTYPEFNAGCEFKDCSHVKESNCEVKKLVENGTILESRYKNYIKFVR